MAPYKKKIVINYPPVTTRRWRPPARDLPHVATPFKRKVFLRRPIYPQKNVYLVPRKDLAKKWKKYIFLLGTNIVILRGTTNQNSLKYTFYHRGKQGACSCLAAIGVLQCCECPNWTKWTIDKILDIGDRIFTDSCKNNPNKQCESIPEVSFFNLQTPRVRRVILKTVFSVF